MSNIEALEQQKANVKDLIARRDLAIKLSGNRDFRKLIMEDFIVTEAARLVAQSGDPALDPQQRADALAMAQAAGHLKRYLSMMIRMGSQAEETLPDLEEALEEARRDEAEDAPEENESSAD